MTDPRISVIVGVTGHRDLREQDKEALQAADFDFSDGLRIYRLGWTPVKDK